MQGPERPADRQAEGGRERDRQRLDHGHRTAEPGAGGRDLRPDETGPDHRQSRALPRGAHPITQRGAVLDGAQHEHAGFGEEPTRRGPGGEHDPVGLDRRAVVQPDAACVDVERVGPVAEAGLESERLERVGRDQRRLLRLPPAREDLLGERRAVIGEVRLGAHQHQAAPEAVAPQRLGGPQAGQRCSDDADDPVAVERVLVAPRAQRPNIASHWSTERGAKT